MDLSSSSREDPFSPESIFSKQDLPVVPNDNPESYCRLCLTTPDVEPLFPMGNDSNGYVLELIGKYIGIELTFQEDFPCSVCRPCQLILDQFDLFRQNCLKVDIAIRRKRLGLDVVVKNEPQDENDEDDEVELPYIRLENKHYQCRVCSETFRSITLFMNHCREEHPEESKMFKCKFCSKAFMTKTARLQHIRSHQPNNSNDADLTGDRVQVCEKCMVTFDSYKMLKIHIKEHHSNDPKQDTLICNTCTKQFSRITILRNHILRVHLGKLPHVCKQCGISYGYAQQLLAHLKTQHGIIMTHAEHLNQSGQSFTEEELEPEEENLHIPPLPPAASEEIQPQPQQEAMEVKKHTNKYTCVDCHAECNSQEELRSHRKLHQDPSWWKCTHCRNFVKHQKMHLLKKHPSISPDDLDNSFQLRYRCWLCRVYFKSLSQLELHANARHQIPLPEHHQVEEPSIEEPSENEHQQQQLPLSVMNAPPIPPPPPPPPMTVQPAMPITPEQLPLLLSQLENGAWDYLREINRFMDPNNISGFRTRIKEEPLDTSQDVMDLSRVGDATASSKHVSFLDVQIKEEMDQDEENENDSEDDYYVRLENRVYQCKLCSETFRHLLLLRKHTKSQHPTEWKSFKCPHCKRRFPSAAIRERHAHYHSLKHPFKCSACDQMYDSKKRMEQHLAACHDTTSSNFTLERFVCETCNLSFSEKKYHDLHARVYHQRKPARLKNLTDRIQVCERCIITFESKELLMDHQKQVHHSDPPLKNFDCPRCSKDLKTVTLLRIHILVVHLGHLPFVCQYCNAAFSSRHWLLKHVEKDHSAQKVPVFKCPSCDETFSDEQKVIDHQDEVHKLPEIEFDPESGIALFPCTKCEKKLESKEQHEKHMIKAHPTFMLLYKCPICTKPIRYRKQHMRIHHDIEYDMKEHHYQTRYKCHCCSKLFQQKRNLVAHQNALAYQCDRCQMRFKTKKNLLAHNSIHKHNRSLKCEDCGLEFGYRARLEEHRQRFHSATSTETLKLLNCPYCPKLFMSSSNRERHITVSHPQSDFQVKCGHCSIQMADSQLLRKHYRAEHAKERVTFKCAFCEKIYLNLSSYRAHFKVHSAEAAEAKEKGDREGTNVSSQSGSDTAADGEGSTVDEEQQPVEIKNESTDQENSAKPVEPATEGTSKPEEMTTPTQVDTKLANEEIKKDHEENSEKLENSAAVTVTIENEKAAEIENTADSIPMVKLTAEIQEHNKESADEINKVAILTDTEKDSPSNEKGEDVVAMKEEEILQVKVEETSENTQKEISNEKSADVSTAKEEEISAEKKPETPAEKKEEIPAEKNEETSAENKEQETTGSETPREVTAETDSSKGLIETSQRSSSSLDSTALKSNAMEIEESPITEDESASEMKADVDAQKVVPTDCKTDEVKEESPSKQPKPAEVASETEKQESTDTKPTKSDESCSNNVDKSATESPKEETDNVETSDKSSEPEPAGEVCTSKSTEENVSNPDLPEVPSNLTDGKEVADQCLESEAADKQCASKLTIEDASSSDRPEVPVKETANTEKPEVQPKVVKADENIVEQKEVKSPREAGKSKATEALEDDVETPTKKMKKDQPDDPSADTGAVNARKRGLRSYRGKNRRNKAVRGGAVRNIRTRRKGLPR